MKWNVLLAIQQNINFNIIIFKTIELTLLIKGITMLFYVNSQLKQDNYGWI